MQLRQSGAAGETVLEGVGGVGHSREGAVRVVERHQAGAGGEGRDRRRIGDETVRDQALVQIGEDAEAAAKDGGFGHVVGDADAGRRHDRLDVGESLCQAGLDDRVVRRGRGVVDLAERLADQFVEAAAAQLMLLLRSKRNASVSVRLGRTLHSSWA